MTSGWRDTLDFRKGASNEVFFQKSCPSVFIASKAWNAFLHGNNPEKNRTEPVKTDNRQNAPYVGKNYLGGEAMSKQKLEDSKHIIIVFASIFFLTFSKSLHVRIGIRQFISSMLLSHHLNPSSNPISSSYIENSCHTILL